MEIKTFRQGQTTYKCGCCGKLTRKVGDEPFGSVCKRCYDFGGYENLHSDNAHETNPDLQQCPICQGETLETFNQKKWG